MEWLSTCVTNSSATTDTVCVKIPKPARRTERLSPAAQPGSDAAVFCGGAGVRNSAPVPDWAQAGGGAGAAGGRSARLAAAAVTRKDRCRAAGLVSAAGPADARGRSGPAGKRGSQEGGVRPSARPGAGVAASPSPAPPRPPHPSGPSPWSGRQRTLRPRFCTPPAPGRPRLAQPLPPRRGDALGPASRSRLCFPAGGLTGTRLTLGARPSATPEQASPRSVLFSHPWLHAPSRLRRTPFYSVVIFSGRRRASLPVRTRGQPFRPSRWASPLRVPV